MNARSQIWTGLAALALLAAPPSDAQTAVLGEPHGLAPALADGTTRGFGLADLDADGDDDLFLARSGAGAVLLGDGSGRFDELVGALPPGAEGARAVALGDVDGDGDQDAALARVGLNALLVNDGSAGFANAPIPLPADAHPSLDALLVDVDLDGDLDLVVANAGANRLYLGDGAGTFAPDAGALGPLAQISNAVVALDADLDGDPELLFGDGDWFLGQPNQLLQGDGGGAFTDASASLPPNGEPTRDLAVGDVDADGDADVLVANGDVFPATQALYLGDGAGGFADGWPTAPTGIAFAAALGDVDADGDLDAFYGMDGLVTLGWVVPAFDRLYRNDGAGGLTLDAGAVPELDEPTGAALLADLDGDGDADALLGARDRLLLADGAGGLALDPTPIPAGAAGARARSVALGDVDGDGDLDAALGNGLDSLAFTPGRQTFLLKNDGTGFLVDDTEASMPVLNPGGELGYTNAMGFADADGDGDLDLFMLRSGDSDGSGIGSYLYGNTGGAFVDWSTQVPTTGEGNDLDFGDVDGDGDLDVAAAQFPREDLFVNDGSGVFASGSAQLPASEPGDVQGVAFGDVDADGDLDLLLGRALLLSGQPPTNALYVNDGTGAFADASAQVPGEVASTWDVALGDADADGDLDAAIANGGAGNDRLWQNDGAGTFVDVTPTALPASGDSKSAAFADLDGDGLPDLLLGTRLFLNQGGGVFADGLAPEPVDGVASLAVGDVDGDDDLDVLLAAEPPRLWRGLARQTARRGPARAGKPFALELIGAPLGHVALAYAAAPGAYPLPPFGTVGLDPATLHVLGVVPLDAHGRAIVSVVAPALVGTTVHVQGFALPEQRFGNREAVTITAW